MILPQYINCQETEVVPCNYYLKDGCKETCAYSDQMYDLGIGAMRLNPSELEEEVEERPGEEFEI